MCNEPSNRWHNLNHSVKCSGPCQHLLDKYDLDLRALALEADMFFSTAGARINAVRAPAAAAGRTQQPPPRSRTPPPRRLNHMDFCYFHRNFGERARRCQSPCSYRPGN